MPHLIDAATPVRTLARDHVAASLRRAIQSGQLRPGDPVHQGEVCARLGVSRTPVREALMELAAGGLVVWEPQRTPRVAPVTANDPVGALQTLGVVMRGVVRHASLQAPRRRAVLDMIDLTLSRLENEDHRAIDRDTARMYHAWVDVSANAVLADTFHPVIDGLAFRLGARRPRAPVPWSMLIDANTELRDAVEQDARDDSVRAIERMHMLDASPGTRQDGTDHGGVQS